LNIIPHFELNVVESQPGRIQRRTMPSAANTATVTAAIATTVAATASNTNNNSASKEKRSSIISLGGSVIPGTAVVAGAGVATTNGQSNSSAAATADGSQTDLASSNNNGNAAKSKANAVSAAAVVPEPYNPLKQLLVTIEHKIRNLEKRKVSVWESAAKDPFIGSMAHHFYFHSSVLLCFVLRAPLAPFLPLGLSSRGWQIFRDAMFSRAQGCRIARSGRHVN